MKRVDRQIVLENNNNTLTDQHIGTLIGQNSEMLGLMATMFPDLSITRLVDSLRNVYSGDKKDNKSIAISPMSYEWEINEGFIKRVPFAQSSTINTTNLGAYDEIWSIFTPYKYYSKNDILSLEDTSHLRVVENPRRINNTLWENKVKLVASKSTTTVAASYMAPGKVSIYRSNAWPEISREGYTKSMFNVQTHRNYMTMHKHGITWSQRYAANEVYYETLMKDGKRTYYKAFEKEQEVLDQWLFTRESSYVFEKSNFDSNGKCRDQEDGQDIPLGDGLIEQVSRYADYMTYTEFSTGFLDMVLQSATARSSKPIGNKFVLLCNTSLYNSFGSAMRRDNILSNYGAWFYSKTKGGDVNIGSNFVSYEFQGNSVTLMPNKALSQTYEEGYGIILNMDKDDKKNRPAMATFTHKGSEMISGSLIGLGGKDGKSSGEISTPVTGSEFYVMGVSGIAFFNPYDSVVISES